MGDISFPVSGFLGSFYFSVFAKHAVKCRSKKNARIFPFVVHSVLSFNV
jgi:hypothetical protein